MSFWGEFGRELIGVVRAMAPFLLFGFLLAGALRTYLPPQWMRVAFGKSNLRSVLLASLVGVPLPLCSCSVLPTAIAMRKGGASKGATVSFLVSTPETGIDSIGVTYALLDPLMTIVRPVAAFLTAAVAGLAVNRVDRGEPAGGIAESHVVKADGRADDDACGDDDDCGCTPGCGCANERPARGIRAIARTAFGELFDDISLNLAIGIVLSGILAALLPADIFRLSIYHGWPAMLIVLAISVPLYVCATSSTPIAAALIAKGLDPGTALVFLLAGPATNAASLSVLAKVLGRRALAAYLASIAVVSLIAGYVVQRIYAGSGIVPHAAIGGGTDVLPAWIEIPCAVVLVALMARSLLKRARKRG